MLKSYFTINILFWISLSDGVDLPYWSVKAEVAFAGLAKTQNLRNLTLFLSYISTLERKQLIIKKLEVSTCKNSMNRQFFF